MLRSLRGALFPNNAMGKSSLSPPANDQELRLLRARCAASLASLVPGPLAGLLYLGRRRQTTLAGGDSDQPLPRSVPPSSPLDHDKAASDRTEQHQHQHQHQHQQQKQHHFHHHHHPQHQKHKHKSVAYSPPTADTIPAPVAPTDVGRSSDVDDNDAARGQVAAEIDQDLLAVFSDAYCNKHLMYAIVELLLVRLMPELAEHGVVDLLSERLN